VTASLPAVRAVTFDFGQTLCDLDTAMLSRRLEERGTTAREDHLAAAVPAAWRAYDDAIRRGMGGHPWKVLMRALLAGAGVNEEGLEGAVDWLWSEQPKKNLWRRPIEGMIELVDELRCAGVPVAVVSNSEGRLAELIDEIGWTDRFAVVADSGRLGIEKPAPGIFHWAAERVGIPIHEIAHVGDSFEADVQGALGSGMRAVWFRGRTLAEPPAEVRRAESAEELRAALRAMGLRAR